MNANSTGRQITLHFWRLILAGVMFLTACSGINPQPAAIYGKWREIHSNMSEAVGTSERNETITLEFRPDGSLILVEDGKTHLHRYRYSGGKRLTLILTSGSLDKTVEFEGRNRMRLIQGRQGVAFLLPIVNEYERVFR